MSKELMTWRDAGCRWVRKWNGNQYVVSCRQLGVEKGRAASRDAANAWWIEKLKTLEAGTIQPNTIRAFTATEGAASYAELSREELIEKLNAHHRNNGSQLHALVGDFIGTGSRSIAKQIKAFLADKKSQAEAKIISVGRWGAYGTHLEIFNAWMGAGAKIDEINSAKVTAYYQHLIKQNQWAGPYQATIFTAFKTFTRFLGEQELIAIPGNLNSKNFKFRTGAKKIKHFTIKEVKELLAAATEQTKLYLLLMLNCGMYQSDVSDLLKSEVDWSKGTITRKRSKTAHHPDTPEVTYKLWDETFKLLKKYKAKEGELALTTAKGKPLKQEEIVNGKLSKSDNIQSAYRRLQLNLKIAAKDRKPLKLLRKTGAQTLESHKEFCRFVEFYLGRPPKTVTEKSYASKDQNNFNEALQWLGEQFN